MSNAGTMSSSSSDLPFEECCREARRAIKLGGSVYQKFTCQKCGARNTIDAPNVFHMSGSCGDCQAVTNLYITGCGFMVHFILGSTLQPRNISEKP